MEEINKVLGEEVSFLKEAFFIPIHEGYFQDKKFLVTHADQKYVLRLFAPQEYELKKKEFAILRKMEAYQVKCPRPLALGLLKEIDSGYLLLSYLEGRKEKRPCKGSQMLSNLPLVWKQGRNYGGCTNTKRLKASVLGMIAR